MTDSHTAEFPAHVLLASCSSGSRGGGEGYLVLLAGGLVRRGHRVSVLMNEHPRMDELAGRFPGIVEIHRVPFPNTYDRTGRNLTARFDLGTRRRLAAALRDLRPDIVHVNKQNLEDGPDLLLAARDSGIPSVADIHVTRSMVDLGAVGGRLRDRFARSVLRQADLPLIGTADRCGRELLEFVGRDGPPVHVVPNGVPAPPAADRDRLRAGWGVRDGEIVLGCVARLEPQKDPLFFVREVMPRLPGHVRLVWVGDGSLRPDVEAAVREHGLGDRVVLDGWRDDAPARLRGLDLFVLPSRFEGFPLSILEAMAAGVPVVANDVDGIREAVADGETGTLVTPGDAAAWVRSLSALAVDEGRRSRQGAAGRARWAARFSVDAMTAATVAVYRTIPGEAGAAA